MGEVDRKPSLEDVRAYAAEQRTLANRVSNPDPGNPSYRPYAGRQFAPTDEYARYLTKKLGPAAALETLRFRAEKSREALKREEEEDRARVGRERARRARERRDSEELAGVTPGRRIDAALVRLQLVSSGGTGTLDAEIRGSSEHPSRALLAHDGHEYRRAISQALGLARRLENVLDRLRRSPLPPEEITDRDEQLRAMAGHSPEEVAVMRPLQGLPRQIRERRAELGLDPETGEPAEDLAA